MDVLLLGGYRFLGRYVIEAAQARGHRVAAFNRGSLDAPPGVEQIIGDRNDPSALRGRHFDAIIDTSGYVPRHVRLAAEALPDVRRYCFVSTLSAYSDDQRAAGGDESMPRQVHPEDADPEVFAMERYGSLKALCEDTLDAMLPGRTIHARPGFIIGPRDYTRRFTMWVERAARPEPMIVPGEPDTPVQVIDVRDLATFLVSTIEDERTGPFNLTGPEQPVLDFARACIAALGSKATPVLVSSQHLIDAGVEQGWEQTPFWIWPELRPLMQLSIARALEAGLTFRPFEETVRDTYTWMRTVVFDPRRGMEARAQSGPRITGIDHADVRVPSLAAVESFYDALLPALGLGRKTESHVGRDGEWYEVAADRPRNAIEYHSDGINPRWFIGFIEDVMTPTRTRIAFRLDDGDKFGAVERLVRDAGGRNVERPMEADYPALFFEDPAGTRLEFIAPRPAR